MMVEQLAVAKPSRPSDEVQVRIANEIRAIKPNRSEPDAVLQHPPDASVNNIPELHKFRSLQSRSHAIISSAGIVDAHDEFVETQYYKELAAIDKQHHTTGSGFIKAVREGGEGGYEIHVNAAETQPRGYKSNPATNDWVPNSEEYQVFVSSKPNRRRVLDDIAR